jgi:hypothetical protein
MAFLTREHGNSPNMQQTLEQNLDSVLEVLHRYYGLFNAVFTYYAALGSGSPFLIQLNWFTSFLEDAKIPDNESKFIKRSDCDTMFIMVSGGEGRSPRVSWVGCALVGAW